MPEWKKSIFVDAIKIRHENREGTYTEILGTYTKLTETEKVEILEALK